MESPQESEMILHINIRIIADAVFFCIAFCLFAGAHHPKACQPRLCPLYAPIAANLLKVWLQTQFVEQLGNAMRRFFLARASQGF